MRHEPGALVRDSEHTVKLVGAHALLAGAEKVEGQKPLVQRDMAILHDRADRHRELLTASGALPKSLATVTLRLLVLQVGFESEGFSDHAAVRANRTFGPPFCFEELTRLVGILKVRGDDSGV